MQSQISAVVAFFSPASIRIGEKSIGLSFAHSIAQKKGENVQVIVFENDDFNQTLEKSEVFCTWCVVGVSPTVTDVARAKQLAGRLLSFGVRRENIWMVLWNEGAPGQVPAHMLEKHLGAFRAKLPFDPALVIRAENSGTLLQRVKPKAILSVRLENLAQEIVKSIGARTLIKESSPTAEALDWAAIERHVSLRVWRALQEQSITDTFLSEAVPDQIDQELDTLFSEQAVQSSHAFELSRLRQNILDHVTGLGPLEKFLRDPSVNEIMVNGTDAIFIERNGVVDKTTDIFDNLGQLQTVIDRMVGRMGRRVDVSSPLCDVRLPDGSRVNVVLPPLSLVGPTITVRRFKTLYRTLDDLVRANTINALQAKDLERAVHERKNILVAGNSGAGKTTLLNVLAGLIPDQERILTLEDAAELQIVKPHVVRLETRSKNAEGLGEVTMSDLLVNALRMRPDRLIIGECRGVEAIPMLQAMNTGHDGSMTTIHANSAEDALKRLESMVLLGAARWPIEVVREQIAAGVDLIVYLKRAGAERKLLEIVDV